MRFTPLVLVAFATLGTHLPAGGQVVIVPRQPPVPPQWTAPHDFHLRRDHHAGDLLIASLRPLDFGPGRSLAVSDEVRCAAGHSQPRDLRKVHSIRVQA